MVRYGQIYLGKYTVLNLAIFSQYWQFCDKLVKLMTSRCICQNYKIYFWSQNYKIYFWRWNGQMYSVARLWIVFVKIAKDICQNCKKNASKLQNVFVQIARLHLWRWRTRIECDFFSTCCALHYLCNGHHPSTPHLVFFCRNFKMQSALRAACNFSALSSDWPNLYGHIDGRPELIMKYQPNDLFILSLVSSTCLALYSYFFERLHDAICWGQQENYSHTFHQIGWPELDHYIRAGK